jgi:mannosyltransferase
MPGMTQQVDATHDAEPAPPPPGPRRRAAPTWPVPVVPALLTLAIGGYRITRAPLWRDELVTWSAALRSPRDLTRLAGTIDAVTTPYYLVMRAWTAVAGDSVLALRLPSLLAMAGAAAVTAALGRRLFDGRAGLVAGALFAVVPSTSRYGQEARAYAFATLAAVAATYLLVRAVQRPARWRWTAYSITVLALGLANLFALTLLAGHLAAVRRASWRGWALAAGVPVVLLGPLALAGHRQQRDQLSWVPRPTVGDIPTLPGGVLQTGVVGGLLIGLAALGWALAGRWGTVLGLGALVPAAILFVGGLVTPLWVPRYLVFVVPLLCVLATVALRPVRWPVAAALVAVVALLGAPEQVGLRKTHEWPRSAPVDYPAATRIVAAGQRPGDGVVFSPRGGWKMLDVALAYRLRGASGPLDVLATSDADARGSLWAAECADPVPCLAGTRRVWLLETGSAKDPVAAVPGPKGAALRTGYAASKVWHVPGLTVALLNARR